MIATWLHSLMVSTLAFNGRGPWIESFWLQFFFIDSNEFMDNYLRHEILSLYPKEVIMWLTLTSSTTQTPEDFAFNQTVI